MLLFNVPDYSIIEIQEIFNENDIYYKNLSIKNLSGEIVMFSLLVPSALTALQILVPILIERNKKETKKLGISITLDGEVLDEQEIIIRFSKTANEKK